MQSFLKQKQVSICDHNPIQGEKMCTHSNIYKISCDLGEGKHGGKGKLVFYKNTESLGCVKIPTNTQYSAYGMRLESRSEDRVLKTATAERYTKVKDVNGKDAGLKVTLKLELEMPKGWIDRTEKWILKSLRKSGYKIRLKLQKFESLRKQQVQQKKM